MRNFVICAAVIGMAAHASAGTASPATPTNDESVSFRWTVDDSWRPVCSVRLTDGISRNKRVSISYRNLDGAHINMTVRMNPDDPQERQISGCVAVDRVLVARH